MIKKLFGETSEEQYQYLKPRLLAFLVAAVMLLAGFLMDRAGLKFGNTLAEIGMVVYAIDLFVFSWSILRGFFGITSFGILLSKNIVLGAIYLTLYLVLGIFGGMIVAIIGLCRFFVLLKERKMN